jgi:hypothetical protein
MGKGHDVTGEDENVADWLQGMFAQMVFVGREFEVEVRAVLDFHL